MNSPCEERRRLFSLLVSPVLHQLPPCDEALARFVKPKTWLLCSESWEEGDAAPSAASSLIWGVWLLHPAAQLLGLVWREGEYAYLGGLRQTCSKVAALILHRCTFWVCCSVFFSSPRPSLRAGKATTLFSRHTKAIIWGMQTRAVQGMLDFDYICSRDEPSVAAMVYPFT